MELKGKAYYCQLVLQDGIEVGIGDHRALSDEELFEGLRGLGVVIDIETLRSLVASCTDPEEVVGLVIPDEKNQVKRGLIYLFLFEMWRRFIKDKKALSVFCDELDYTIALFYEEQLGNEEYLQGLLSRLEGILEEAVDAGAHPQIALRAIGTFFTHSVESFIYDYIVFQLGVRNFTFASELIDGFYAYLADPRFFDLLRLRMVGDMDILYQHFLESLLDEPDFALAIEAMHYLISMGQPRELSKVLKVAFSQMQTEEDVEELVEILGEYLRSLDKADATEILQALPEPYQRLFL